MAHRRRPAVRDTVRGQRASLKKTRAFILALLLGTTLFGCATVKPYEREYLSRPSMDLEREATEQKFYSHVLDAREGATGGFGNAGGGCGCN